MGLAGALKRELTEEFGVSAFVHEQVDTWQQSHNGSTRQHHIFRVTLDSTDLTSDPGEILAVRWFTPDEVASLWTTTGYEERSIRKAL